MLPKLIPGGLHADFRGNLFYNNSFDTSAVKRIYIIENLTNDIVRGWQGHKIEQRWFSAITGSFIVNLVAIDNWESPSENLDILTFEVCSEKLDILYVPAGYVSTIQSKEIGSKLLVMADYGLNEINDEFRLPIDYFKNNNYLRG